MSPKKKNRSFFKREKPSKKILPSILIVCEDLKFERRYFKSLIVKLNQKSSSKLEVVGVGATPDYVVKEAIELKRKRKAISLFFQYDDVWCVFDTEGPQYTPTHFLSAIRLAEENNIKLSISNPCFEFWILLHYTDQASGLAHDCAEIVKRIKKENPSYYKGNCAIFDSIHSEVDTAIERARYLCENHHIDEDILDRNPSTEVYKLVEFLKSISPES